VRVPSIAPPINCGEIEIAGGRVGLWKSARYQVRERRTEIGNRFAKPTGGKLWRDISRLDAEAHFNDRESQLPRAVRS
jgi:hypothetical protein